MRIFIYRKLFGISTALVLLISISFQAFASTNASINIKNGLPIIEINGSTATDAKFVNWGKAWKWAGSRNTFEVVGPFQYLLKSSNKTLQFDLSGKISAKNTYTFQWDVELDAKKDFSDVIGGGIEFDFDLKSFGKRLGNPEILPDNAGWRWGKNDNNAIEFRISPSAAKVYFERGQKHKLRVFFFSEKIIKKKQKFTITLKLPENSSLKPSTTERFSYSDKSQWSKDVIHWRNAPVDLSFLNKNEKPAGKRGFLKVRNEKLFFEDGTEARFWGTNITANAIFKTPSVEVQKQAKRLSKLGFNLVRFTHIDSSWVKPNIFGDEKQADTQYFDKESLKKLDWWIHCLKEEGIYVWLDLHIQRKFKPDDNIFAFDEINKRKIENLKGYNYVNLTMQLAMKRYNEMLLTHINPHTGLDYRSDPAIITLLITNENDITHHYGNQLLTDKNVPKHTNLYMAEANGFARKSGLPKRDVWRSWEHGPSKIFLNDLEYRFNRLMLDHLELLESRTLVATTSSWGANPLSSLPALTSGYVIDVHSYGKNLELENNPLYSDNMIHWMAAGQIIDKPMTVSEWNVETFPVPDRHTTPLLVAANAAHQGWDAMMQYAYAQIPINHAGRASNWEAFNDPSLISMLPAAAIAYRLGHIDEAITEYVFTPNAKDLFYKKISPRNSIGLRTASEKGKLLIAMPKVKELPWLEESKIPINAVTFSDPNKSFINENDRNISSDNGQISRNWKEGILTINTPKTQAALGWIGDKNIKLDHVEIRLKTKNASVSVQSLTEKPITESRHLLVSLGGQSEPVQGKKLPFLSEPVIGVIKIQALEGSNIYKKTKALKDIEVPFNYSDGEYSLELTKNLETYWLELIK